SSTFLRSSAAKWSCSSRSKSGLGCGDTGCAGAACGELSGCSWERFLVLWETYKWLPKPPIYWLSRSFSRILRRNHSSQEIPRNVISLPELATSVVVAPEISPLWLHWPDDRLCPRAQRVLPGRAPRARLAALSALQVVSPAAWPGRRLRPAARTHAV